MSDLMYGGMVAVICVVAILPLRRWRGAVRGSVRRDCRRRIPRVENVVLLLSWLIGAVMKRPFIVAEMSANHLGSLNRALNIVDAAAWAGADAIKVQTWTPGGMCIDRAYTLQHGPWAGKRLVDLYEEAFLPWEWHASIFQHARARGLIPFSAAFDCKAVDFLETLGVDRHKVASFELTDLPLIRYMASKGKPMILSTGMATADEVIDAIRAAAAGLRASWSLMANPTFPRSQFSSARAPIRRPWYRRTSRR
jgi:hypothetical protein